MVCYQQHGTLRPNRTDPCDLSNLVDEYLVRVMPVASKMNSPRWTVWCRWTNSIETCPWCIETGFVEFSLKPFAIAAPNRNRLSTPPTLIHTIQCWTLAYSSTIVLGMVFHQQVYRFCMHCCHRLHCIYYRRHYCSWVYAAPPVLTT